MGCGGWQYFTFPGADPLRLYSLAFRFVEVNSTFYRIPNLKTVESWRRRVPHIFEFSVKANRVITHLEKLRPSDKAADYLERCLEICGVLRSRILILELPKSTPLSESLLQDFRKLLKRVDLRGVRIAVEPRSGWKVNEEIVKSLVDLKVVPVADYSKEEPPYDDEEVSYSRLFGFGEHNIYQFTDDDLNSLNDIITKEDILSMANGENVTIALAGMVKRSPRKIIQLIRAYLR